MSDSEKKEEAVSGLASTFSKQLNVDAPEFVPSFAFSKPSSAKDASPPLANSEGGEPGLSSANETSKTDKSKLEANNEQVAEDWEANADDDEYEEEGNIYCYYII